MYGGLQVGVGVFPGSGALRATWTAPALGAPALTFGGLAPARVAGMVSAVAVELVVTAIAITAPVRSPGPFSPGRVA